MVARPHPRIGYTVGRVRALQPANFCAPCHYEPVYCTLLSAASTLGAAVADTCPVVNGSQTSCIGCTFSTACVQLRLPEWVAPVQPTATMRMLHLSSWQRAATIVRVVSPVSVPYVITLGADASPAEAFAAKELASFCGDVPVVAPTVAANVPQLAVGFAAASALGAMQINAELAGLGDEGFLVTNRGLSNGSVVISGGRNTTRGTLYAVYHTATKLLNMRFYAPDETKGPTVPLPLAPASLAPAGTFHDRVIPALEYRALNGYQGLSAHRDGVAWQLREPGIFDARTAVRAHTPHRRDLFTHRTPSRPDP